MFSLSRSVRQGAPLSAYLYIIQAEPLAETVRKCNDIRGISVTDDGAEVKITAFANNATGYLNDADSGKEMFYLKNIKRN